MKLFRSSAVLAIYVVLFFYLLRGQALAQNKSPFISSGSLEVSPAIFEVDLEKSDEEKTIVLTYTNRSKQFLSVEIYPIDFKQKDGVGAISFLGQEAGSYSYSLSSFLTFDSRTLELAPNEKKDLNVTIKNRTDLSPGGHYAAVIAKVVVPYDKETQTSVAPSLSSLILLRKVGGERFNLSLREMSFPKESVVTSTPQTFSLTFRNEGNIHLVPYGRAEIKDFLGRMIYKGVLNTSSLKVFPSSIRYIPVELDQQTWQFPISLNTIVVRGNDSLKKTNFMYQESYVYVNPWLGGVIVGIIGIYGLRRLRKIRSHKASA